MLRKAPWFPPTALTFHRIHTCFPNIGRRPLHGHLSLVLGLAFVIVRLGGYSDLGQPICTWRLGGKLGARNHHKFVWCILCGEATNNEDFPWEREKGFVQSINAISAIIRRMRPMAICTWVFGQPCVLRRLGGHLYLGVGRPICSWRLGNQLGAVLTK